MTENRNDNEILAEILFPDVDKTPDYYEEKYPPRQLPEGARVTRFAPSPTGFLHIGGLFAAMAAKRTADETGGVFYLRIEDTDKKREVEDGVTGIVRGLHDFGIDVSEGVTGPGTESGAYGPYVQSARRDIYHCFAKNLVQRGLAYPCFCTAEELADLRAKQEADGVNPGYYGEYAVCRNLTVEQVKHNLEADVPYVLRFRSPGSPDGKVRFQDVIKGKLELPENIMDIVLLKTDGMPTYHFAHVVDDHLMRTTHVVRGDEWISSVPTHLQLFAACGFKAPKYAHIAPIMKLDEGNKRKLSKRKDPEAAVQYYVEEGYPEESVNEYLLTLANSDFEDWRRANKTAPADSFPFKLKKMSVSGALFDLDKLNDVSRNVISVMDAETVYQKTADWAEHYAPEFYALAEENRDRMMSILRIGRGGKKPRKDIDKWSDLPDLVSYFFDALYKPCYALPDRVNAKDAAGILKAYKGLYSAEDDNSAWFEKVKQLCEPFGYTPNVKEYKTAPDAFKGHVGDVSTVIRIAVTSRTNTPDLCTIMQILGQTTVMARLDDAIAAYEEMED